MTKKHYNISNDRNISSKDPYVRGRDHRRAIHHIDSNDKKLLIFYLFKIKYLIFIPQP